MSYQLYYIDFWLYLKKKLHKSLSFTRSVLFAFCAYTLPLLICFSVTFFFCFSRLPQKGETWYCSGTYWKSGRSRDNLQVLVCSLQRLKFWSHRESYQWEDSGRLRELKPYHYYTDVTEIRAFIGILYYCALWDCTNVDNEILWSKDPDGDATEEVPNSLDTYIAVRQKDGLIFLTTLPCTHYDQKNATMAHVDSLRHARSSFRQCASSNKMHAHCGQNCSKLIGQQQFEIIILWSCQAVLD